MRISDWSSDVCSSDLDPRIILLLLVLVTAIAFNLAGLFELSSVNAGSSLAEKPGSAGSFWTGVLAAFIATPCTGPFMGAAMGAALILPVPLVLVILDRKSTRLNSSH